MAHMTGGLQAWAHHQTTVADQNVAAAGFTSVQAMTTLLTVESLVFAVASVAIALMFNVDLPVNPEKGARVLMIGSAVVVSVLALGALVAWADQFLDDFPSGIGRLVPVFCLALGILAQPVLAWTIAWLTLRRAGGER